MEKKTALITGSYGGLGTCFVKIHARNGGGLILVGRSQKKLDEQAESVKNQYGVEVHTIAADLSLPETAQAIYDTCKEKGWEVDYLINNAGFGGQGDFSCERTMEQDMSSGEIAFLLGYQEINSFLRVFSLWTGMSIGEFKKVQK